MRTRIALLVLAGALGGCATTDASQPVTAPPPSVVASPSPSRAAGTPVPSASLMSVRGKISDGVEPGCVLLTAEDTKTYLLVGGDKAALVTGRTVTVWGTPEPEMMSTCMQGTPFQVSRVEG